jgi:hypothetical protein
MSRRYLFFYTYLLITPTHSAFISSWMEFLNWRGTDDDHSEGQFNSDSRFQLRNLSELLV